MIQIVVMVRAATRVGASTSASNSPRKGRCAAPARPCQPGNTLIAATLLFNLAAAMCAVAATSTARADDLNDYPTTARADYVFGCMKANGETRRALEQCSCSIDVIATLLPYERYVTAETVLSMAQVPGTLGNQFRSTEYAKAAVDELRRAQAEAEVRCF